MDARAYIAYLRLQECWRCGGRPVDPHHLPEIGQRAMGKRPSDWRTAPLCRPCHDWAHAHPAESRVMVERGNLSTLIAWLESDGDTWSGL